MKRLQSEVKAAAEKQQTDAHHREREGERWWRRGAETDSERHLAEDSLIPALKENTAKQPACLPETTQLGYVQASPDTCINMVQI